MHDFSREPFLQARAPKWQSVRFWLGGMAVGVAVTRLAGKLVAGRGPPQRDEQCPPREWLLDAWGTGHWILDHTDQATWSWYMDFLEVPEASRPDEYNCSDIHQYIFTEKTFAMNHTIPHTNFSLQFESGTEGEWVKNPYPALTPAGFDPRVAKVNLTTWRNAWDDGPRGKSCEASALRTEMPVVKNITDASGRKVKAEFITVFWRELETPNFMKASLYVKHTNGTLLEPWASKGFSYRYFRKTVQSFGDSARRLPCVPAKVNPKLSFC